MSKNTKQPVKCECNCHQQNKCQNHHHVEEYYCEKCSCNKQQPEKKCKCNGMHINGCPAIKDMFKQQPEGVDGILDILFEIEQESLDGKHDFAHFKTRFLALFQKQRASTLREVEEKVIGEDDSTAYASKKYHQYAPSRNALRSTQRDILKTLRDKEKA